MSLAGEAWLVLGRSLCSGYDPNPISICQKRITNLAGSWEGFGLVTWLGGLCSHSSWAAGSPAVMEEEQEAGRLSPCSELLQHAPFEESSSKTQNPRGTGLVGERGERAEDTRDAKKAGIESREGSGAQKQA